jgi:competence protein ComFC
MTCLLCGGTVPQALSLLDILTFREATTALCPTCDVDFTRIGKNFCPRCHRANDGEVCEDCGKWESIHNYHVNNLALFCYDDAMHEFFSLYKFLGDYRLRQTFILEMPTALRSFLKDYVLVPIPLSSERLQSRGFNQVTGMLEACHLPYVELLEKVEVEKMSAKARHDRIFSENPFRIREGIVLPEKAIIVDDIYTTGTTIFHAYLVLKNAGVTDVRSFTLCR